MPATPENSPEPEDFDARHEEARARLERRERLGALARNFLLVGGGTAIVAALIVPTRSAGASRSAFLKWQARDAEIARAAAEAAARPPAR